MSNLLKEAIADAKAVRATALANAKAALEEAFNTKAEAMLAEKLKQEIAADEAVSSSEIGSGGVGASHAPDKGAVTHQDPQGGPKVVSLEEEGAEETVTNEEIDEILKELEAELEEEGQAQTEPVAAAPEAPVAPSPEAPVAAAPEAPVAPAAPAPEAPVSQEPEAQVGEEMDEEIDLNELLASLEEGEIEEGKEEGEEEKGEEKGEEKEKTDEAVYAELQEAYKVVEYLRNQLSEINLLNSKLLYTNKLFNTFSLTKEQKTKVVETFDLAKSIREVKLSYAILSESYSSGGSVVKKTNTTAKTITEGLASKPVASTAPAKEVIVENSNVMASRFQKLAGIKK